MKPLKLIVEKLQGVANEKNNNVFEKISSLNSDLEDLNKKIFSLQAQEKECQEQIRNLVFQEDDFLFAPGIFSPLKPVNTNYLKQHNPHRGGWYALLNYMHNKKYFSDQAKTLLVDILEHYFVWNNMPIITEPWIGISHLTPNTPANNRLSDVNLLLENQNFKASLKNCKGLVFLTDYMKNYADIKFNRTINSFFIKHPVGTDFKQFKFKDFWSNKNKKVILLGKQMRKVSSIYFLKTKYRKAWMPGSSNKEDMHKLIKSEMNMLGKEAFKDFNPSLVEFLYVNSPQEYDNIITSNIMFLDFYDASANNSILELMRSKTPFFCRRLAATEEYLGRDYPMFFNNLEFVEVLLNNDDYMIDLYQRTHEYLLKLDMSDLSHDFFAKKLLRIIQ